MKILETFHKETHSFLRKRFNRSLLVTRRKNGFHIKVAGEIFCPTHLFRQSTNQTQYDCMLRHTNWRKEICRKYQNNKSRGNIRTGNLQVILGQEINMIYQDRTSTGNIRTGSLQDISDQEVYRQYQDMNLRVISRQ